MEQKFLTSKNVIICDYREEEISYILEKSGFKIIKENLDVGDFILSKDICIERKSYSDFVSSLIDKRIFTQCENLSKNFRKPIIIVELFSKLERDVNENFIYSSLAKLISTFNISIIFSRNMYETSKIIKWLKVIEDEENKNLSLLYVGKKPKDILEIKKFILSSFPGISEKNAEKLIKNFKSLYRIFTSNYLELSKVIGKKRSKKFFEILKDEKVINSGD
ncbi:MAG: ERCC4 domain-containing protein [Candidatus Aenigmatarchaeota archaeon]